MVSRVFGFVVLSLCLMAASAEKKCEGTATYKISFMGTWSKETHVNSFPDAGAKFSPLAGCSHNGKYMMWDVNMKASEGIQQVAEKGNASTLYEEIMMEKNKGNAYMYTEAKGFDAPGEAKSYIRVSYEFPMVSLISMIIPSSDWFVGVKKVELCGEDGWKPKVEMDNLQPWDAGSKDGTTFESSQVSTDPQGMIKMIIKEDDTPFKSAQDIPSLGKIVLERVCDGQQKYMLNFTGSWNNQDHPTDFPSNAHFSPLIGASHSCLYRFWEAGGVASAGVKQVAETGATGTLETELKNAKNMDPKNILQIIKGKNFNSPGVDRLEVEVDGMHSKVSVISMLAPSPDWFVGIDSFDLCNGWTWKDMAEEGDLPPWDSGTDDGKRFRSSNAETNPVGKIEIIQNTEDTSFKSEEPIKSLGKFVFKRHYVSTTMGPTTQPAESGVSSAKGTTQPTESGVSSVKGSAAGLLLACSFVFLAARVIF